MVSFKPPFLQFNGHLQTIFPSIFRKIKINYSRERIDLPDGDFLDLDWSRTAVNNTKLLIVTHGLEGDSARHYVTGVVRIFNNQGYDALAWNCRSCSGEINRVERFYHHGDAEDLRYVTEYAIRQVDYKEIVLIGFSMGGSLTLRLLGENPKRLLPQIKVGIGVSVPIDLRSSVNELYKNGKRFYMRRFLKKLGKKIKIKSKIFPDNPLLNYEGYDKIKNFHQFDSRYTAPLHGYDNADSFYALASVKPLLKNIKIPTLIIQAKNDPFLSAECLALGYEGSQNTNIVFEVLTHGGHVGFMQANTDVSFVDNRALAFARQHSQS